MTDSSIVYPRASAGVKAIGTTKPALTAATVDGFYLVVGKRLLDILLVLLLAPLALPLILLASLALWIEGGNPFYHQDRLGRHGERFRIYKLRTMVRNADKMLETCLAKDPELRAEWDALPRTSPKRRMGGMRLCIRAPATPLYSPRSERTPARERPG